MRTKVLYCFLAIISIITLSAGYSPIEARGADYTVEEVEALIDGIISYKLEQTGSGNEQEWINGELSRGAGKTSEWYIAALSQNGSRDLGSYEKALRSYLDANEVYSATSREKYALALAAAGSDDPYMAEILDDSIGGQGIMSYIYGLHVLNNGYSCDRFTADSVVGELLSRQYPDGGWALFGSGGDVDVTAMTISSLAPYYASRGDVREAVDRGIAFLSSIQDADGGYSSFGAANTESAAQVLTALSSVGIDCMKDERFLKNGRGVVDGIVAYRLPDGSFRHVSDGGSNESATVQALYSLVAYKRMREGKPPFWVFDNRRPIKTQGASEPHTPDEGNGGDAPVSPETPEPDGNGGGVSQTVTTAVSGTTASTTAPAASSRITSSAVSTAFISATVSETTAETERASVSEETEGAETTSAPKSYKKAGDYKPKAIAIIIISAGILCVIIFVFGKRNYKNFIAVGVAAGVAIAIVVFTDIRSTKEYYNGEKVVKENAIGTVTMTIRCDTIVGKSDSEFVPDDGVILDVTEFDIEEGETVFDILTEAARTYRIQIENKGSAGSAHGMVYISGINYIYEMEYGDLSGWVYHVNGITPSRNCGEYVLKDGDRVEWLYTCELGRDLDEVYEE